MPVYFKAKSKGCELHPIEKMDCSRSSYALRHLGLSVSIGLMLAGCAVGPDFKTPAPPQGVGKVYGSAELPANTEAVTSPDAGSTGAAQHIKYGQELPEQWWTLFHSEALDQLIRSALKQNPTYAMAQASLRQAKENFTAETGLLEYPSVNAQLGVTRERAQLGSVTPSVFNLYNASVNVSYTVDVFGGSRRQLESLMAGVDYQQFQLEAAYQMLVSNVVTTAIKEASLRAQLQATQNVLKAQKTQLEIIEKLLALGAITRPVELAQSTLVAQTKAQLPPLEKLLAQTRHQLAVYVGKLPGEAGLPEFQLDSLTLPQDLPVSLPSELVRKRPDIRASEALLHEASAQLGVATANQYPQINLTGSYSVNSVQMGSSNPTSTLWNLGAGLTQPLFNGGALSAKRRAAAAAYDQAEAQYRGTVLSAFQNVADNLRAIDSDASALAAQANAERLARESLEISRQQYQLGGVNYLSLLDAERVYEQARINLVVAQSARLSDTAALFASSGGGWWNRQKEEAVIAKDAP
jgi:NodT family efflux transporter outer membrane factor (OMF) lipoprotein